LGQGGDNAGHHCDCNQQENDPFHNGSSFKDTVIEQCSEQAL
jgi:hypothetical protein